MGPVRDIIAMFRIDVSRKKGCTVAAPRPDRFLAIRVASAGPSKFICMSPYYMVLDMRTGGCLD